MQNIFITFLVILLIVLLIIMIKLVAKWFYFFFNLHRFKYLIWFCILLLIFNLLILILLILNLLTLILPIINLLTLIIICCFLSLIKFWSSQLHWFHYLPWSIILFSSAKIRVFFKNIYILLNIENFLNYHIIFCFSLLTL